MMGTGAVYKIVEVGYLSPRGMIAAPELGAGEVGYLTASIKTISDTRVGDTVTGLENPAAEALPGYCLLYTSVCPVVATITGVLTAWAYASNSVTALWWEKSMIISA